MSLVKVVALTSGNKADSKIGGTSWSLSALLAGSGFAIAHQVAVSLATMLQGCIIFACSPLIRAQQNLFAIMEGLGMKPSDFDLCVWFDRDLWSGHPQTWYLNPDSEPDNPHQRNSEIFKQRPEEVLGEGDLVFGAIQRVAKITRLADQSISLCMSHRGTLDAAIMVAKHSLDECAEIGSLREGEGAIFFFEDDKLVRVDDLIRTS